MELGEKLKNARLEAGLSQRQLCGDTITRNMLSLIENGSAKPSYATLQILSSRLGKPVSYFVPDAPSENLALLYKATQAEPKEALEILKGYLAPDPMLDEWYEFFLTFCRLELAEQALSERRIPYAQGILQEAALSHSRFSSLLQKKLALLQYEAGLVPASQLTLPDNTDEMLLRARAAWEQNRYDACLSYLDGADGRSKVWHRLRGDALMALGRYEDAIACFLPLEEGGGTELCARLEECYRQIRNFEKAYEYACKQR